MPRTATKAAESVYYQARIAAGITSREEAAPLLKCDPRTLAKYELGELVPQPDMIVRMAYFYNKPSLVNNHCVTQCAIGMQCKNHIEEKDITLISLQILNNLRGVERAKDTLLEITADGEITEDEIDELANVMSYFLKVEKTISELKLYIETNINFDLNRLLKKDIKKDALVSA